MAIYSLFCTLTVQSFQCWWNNMKTQRFAQPEYNHNSFALPLIKCKLLNFSSEANKKGSVEGHHPRTSMLQLSLGFYAGCRLQAKRLDLKGYGQVPWVWEAKLSESSREVKSFFGVFSVFHHAREEWSMSRSISTSFLPATSGFDKQLANWNWKGFFGESYRRRGGYELTALLAHNLVFRKHLRECVCDIRPALGFLKVA